MNEKDLQKFFKKRMLELYDKNSLDSYRVRSNNIISLMKELREVIVGWYEYRIKRFETVKLCIEETISALEDDCLSTENSDMNTLKEIMNSYSKEIIEKNEQRNISRAQHMIFYIDKFLLQNEDSYLENTFGKISETIFKEENYEEKRFTPILDDLEKHISDFGCELLRLGYSKRELYLFFKKLNSKVNFTKDDMKDIKETFCTLNKQEYTVVFILNLKSKFQNETLFPMFKSSIRSEYKKLIKENTLNSRYFINKVNALTPANAIQESYQELAYILDTIQLGNDNKNINIFPLAHVFLEEDISFHKWGPIYTLDVSDIDIHSITDLAKYVTNINEDNNIEIGCKKRLQSALRHLRMGDSQVDIEQKFINYWIALEFLFASASSNDSTFPRMVENIKNIMASCYIKRNIEHLNNWLKNKKYNGDYWGQDNFDINDNKDILLKYRFKKIKSSIHNSNSRKDYIDKHLMHLDQHLARLYRLRNELVHEAAIKSNIENVTSNLRYYLVFILNQSLIFFYNCKYEKANMDTFFWYYECLYKNIQKSDYDLSKIQEVQINKKLIN